MPAYMISHITITDSDKFADYMHRTQHVARGFGAKMLARGKLAETLAGTPAPGQMVVVAEFPDLDALRRWNASPEYQALIPLREAASDQVMTAYEAG